MSTKKRQELIDRYNELCKKYDETKSWVMKGWYQGEMSFICDILRKDEKE